MFSTHKQSTLRSSAEVTVVQSWDWQEHYIDVLVPCDVAILRKKVAGTLDVKAGFSLVCRGRRLVDGDDVPASCFREDDPHDVWIVKTHADTEEQEEEAPESDNKVRWDEAVRLVEAVGTFKHERTNELERDLLGREGGEQLVAEGYGDRGAFDRLTDDVLAGSPFWFHRRQRQSLLELVVEYRNKDERRVSALDRLSSNVSAITNGGDVFFTSKASMRKFWNKAETFAGDDNSNDDASSWLGPSNVGKAVPDVVVRGKSLQAHLNATLHPVIARDGPPRQEAIESLQKVLLAAFPNGGEQFEAMLEANKAGRATGLNAQIKRLASALYDHAAAQRPPPGEQRGDAKAIQVAAEAERRAAREKMVQEALSIPSRDGVKPETSRLIERIKARPDCDLDEYDLPVDSTKPLPSIRTYCCEAHATRVRTRLADLAERHRASVARDMRRFLEKSPSEPTRDELHRHLSELLSPPAIARRNGLVPAKERDIEMTSDVSDVLASAATDYDRYDKPRLVAAVADLAGRLAVGSANPGELDAVLAIVRARDDATRSDAIDFARDSVSLFEVGRAVDAHFETVASYVECRNAGLLMHVKAS